MEDDEDEEVDQDEDEDEEDGEVRLPSHFLKAMIATSGTGASAAQRRVQAGASESCAATDSPRPGRPPSRRAPAAAEKVERWCIWWCAKCNVQNSKALYVKSSRSRAAL